jgi:cation:H+ antiporter
MEIGVIGLLAGGFVALIVGGEVLVRGASHLAGALGLSPLVIGLTVVAFGTSAPELAVGVTSALGGEPDIALGNVVGSNIANVLLVLGLAALVTPVTAGIRVVRREVPIMIAASLTFWLMALGGSIQRFEGLLFVAAIVVYTVTLVRGARREEQVSPVEDVEAEARTERVPRALGTNVALVAVGLVGLVLGAGWIVDGATAVATGLGIPEIIIGLTIVAGGTSLPEITTSVVAGLRGHRDLAVGNVVGSCLFNLLMVLGVTALVSSEPVPVSPDLLAVDVPLMVAAAVACLPIIYTGLTVDRREGSLLLAFYVAYLAYLLLVATDAPAAAAFGSVLILGAVPVAGVVLGVLAARQWRGDRRAALALAALPGGAPGDPG